MKLEKEITVKVNCSLNELSKHLKNKGFKIYQKYSMEDVYLIPETLDLTEELEMLKKCVLVRNVIGFTKQIVYKYKKYNEKGNILEQGKTKCEIYDVNEAIELFKSIGFKELFTIYDEITMYANDSIELAVQLVNNKHIFIEVEDKCQFISKRFETIDEMISELEKYDIDYDKSDYFVKKALITLKEAIKK